MRHVEPIYENLKIKTNCYCAFATCNHCGNGIVSNRHGWLREELSPPVIVSLDLDSEWLPKTELNEIPENCSDAVTKAFKEASDIIETSSSLSCTGFRKTIELALKEIDPENNPKKLLAQRIKDLATNHSITKSMADWADHIKLEGNAGAHDFKECTEEQAEYLRKFTYYFLTYLFTLPNQIERAKNSKPTEPT